MNKMNKMNNKIVEILKEKIEANARDYAHNFIAKAFQSELNTPDSKKQVDAAGLNMDKALKQIEWLENYLKKVSVKTKKVGK
jgi:hypothetical protein